jgi:hypothetical protein
LNSRYFWRLDYRSGHGVESVEFRTNTTIWNRSFRRFHELLSEANPSAVKTPWRWWHL